MVEIDILGIPRCTCNAYSAIDIDKDDIINSWLQFCAVCTPQAAHTWPSSPQQQTKRTAQNIVVPLVMLRRCPIATSVWSV